jgi:hypothetical protein
MRVRVGPVRVGGGRRASFTVGAGPVGVTVGGRRKRSGGWTTSTTSSDSSYEPTQEEIDRWHARQVHQKVVGEASAEVLSEKNEHEEPFLWVFLIRCGVMCAFGLLILISTRNVEHVLVLYLCYTGALLVGLSPAAMLFRLTTVKEERWRLFDGVEFAVQTGRTNFAACYLPIWLFVAGAFLIEKIASLEEDYVNVISLTNVLKFFALYLVFVTVGVAVASKMRTKSSSSAVMKEELKLLLMNHCFVSVPKNSMLRYELLLLEEKYLNALIARVLSEPDPVYKQYYAADLSPFNDSLHRVVKLRSEFEAMKDKSSEGRELIFLSQTGYRDKLFSENLKKERAEFSERVDYWTKLYEKD